MVTLLLPTDLMLNYDIEDASCRSASEKDKSFDVCVACEGGGQWWCVSCVVPIFVLQFGLL